MLQIQNRRLRLFLQEDAERIQTFEFFENLVLTVEMGLLPPSEAYFTLFEKKFKKNVEPFLKKLSGCVRGLHIKNPQTLMKVFQNCSALTQVK